MIRIVRPACPDPDALRTNYKAPVNKAELVKASHGKCMYCESGVSHVYFGDVEHIKPKDRFPELEFEWTNLGFVCAKCNNAKRNKWFDETPFLDPYSEDPGAELSALGQWLFSRPGSDRARVTISEIDLNRPELLEKRLAKLLQLQEILDLMTKAPNEAVARALGRRLDSITEEAAEYLFICRTAYMQLNG